MSFYSELAITATKLLTEKGEQAVFTRRTTGTFDPVTGTSSGDTVSTFNAKVYPSTFSVNQVNGESILMGDKKLIMQAGNKPQINDKVTMSGKFSTVVSFSSVGLTSDEVIYVVQTRS
tara:strand:- start:938 stop:1291 length:354 start_codon:yes stop_codon:yes gene_type:complete